MKTNISLTIIVAGLLLFGNGQPLRGAIKETVPNIEALWRQYFVNAAGKAPTKNFPYAHCFRSAAQKYDLPMTLLLAVARGESNFNPRAQSDRNCHGLMQIQWPGTARHLGIYRLQALYEPCTNIDAGAKYLRELLNRYNQNLHLALAAYNYGPSRIDRRVHSGQIPRGAIWYSGYIYHHLQHIVPSAAAPVTSNLADKPRAYRPKKRLVLITFNQPYRANAYYQYLQRRAPSLSLDWYRIGSKRYQVVMLYSDKNNLQTGKTTLKKLGVTTYTR